MWLPIVIIVLAIAMVIGPVMLMQPTRQQRREAARRQHAAMLGLRVHLQPPPPGSDVDAGVKQLAMYCLPWQEVKHGRNTWCLVRKAFEHEMHAFGCWEWQKQPDQLLPSEAINMQVLSALPEEVVAVAAGPQGLCCYWLERGDLDRVDQIASWLQSTVENIY